VEDLHRVQPLRQRTRNVVLDELKRRMILDRGDIPTRPGQQVIEANDGIPIFE